jgi:drug/metabolite transporter (DMT)-like permease
VGVAAGVGAAILTALMVIVLRRLRNLHFSVLLLSYAVLGVVQTGSLCVTVDVLQVPQTTHDLLVMCLALPTVLLFAQIALSQSLKYGEAAPMSIVKSLGVVFSFLWQFLIFGVPPDGYTWAGAAIILSAVIANVLRKWLEGLPLEDGRRRTWRFFLL